MPLLSLGWTGRVFLLRSSWSWASDWSADPSRGLPSFDGSSPRTGRRRGGCCPLDGIAAGEEQIPGDAVLVTASRAGRKQRENKCFSELGESTQEGAEPKKTGSADRSWSPPNRKTRGGCHPEDGIPRGSGFGACFGTTPPANGDEPPPTRANEGKHLT